MSTRFRLRIVDNIILGGSVSHGASDGGWRAVVVVVGFVSVVDVAAAGGEDALVVRL